MRNTIATLLAAATLRANAAQRASAVPPAPSEPLRVATGGSSTLERYFSDYTGYTDNPRVTYSTDGTTFGALGGTGAGAHTLGDLLVTGLNRDVKFLKAGVRGTTLAQWESSPSTHRAALVAGIIAMGGVSLLLLQVGYNDATSSSTITTASHATMLRSLISKIRTETSLPNLKVLLGGSQRNLAGNANNEGQQAGIIRRAEMLLADDANVFFACPTFDIPLAGDNIHQTETGYVTMSAPRWAQSIIGVLASSNSKRGPHIVSAAPVTTTTTDLTIAHDESTDFTPTSGITGFSVSKDAGATFAAATGARINATTIRLTHVDSGGAAQQVLHASLGAPDVTAPLADNTSPRSLPLEVTATGIAVAAGALNINGNPAGATQNISYSYTPTASGGTPPYSFAASGAALPTGLTLNTLTGEITGTPTFAATTNGITITVTDAMGATANQTISITVTAAAAPTWLDNFAGTNGASLAGRTPDTGSAWTVPTGSFDIQGNRARPVSQPSNALGGTTLPLNCYVAMPAIFLTTTTEAFFVLARASNTSNFYQAGYRPSTGSLSLGKTVSGGFAEITAVAWTPSAGQTYLFRIEAREKPGFEGTTAQIRLLVDGVEKIGWTDDTSFLTAGVGGIRVSGAAAGMTTGTHFEYVQAGPLA